MEKLFTGIVGDIRMHIDVRDMQGITARNMMMHHIAS